MDVLSYPKKVRKRDQLTPLEHVCTCVNVSEIDFSRVVFEQVFQRLSKTQNGSDMEQFLCFPFSLKMEAD
jgi:hypothetical protein